MAYSPQVVNCEGIGLGTCALGTDVLAAVQKIIYGIQPQECETYRLGWAIVQLGASAAQKMLIDFDRSYTGSPHPLVQFLILRQ